MTRARQSLGEPPPRVRLRGFPRSTLPSGRPIYRAHSAGNRPWWFASALDGRFDLPAPDGTCYLADTIDAALRERWGRRLVSRNTVTTTFADATVVSRLTVPSSHRLADLCSARAAQFGVTREIHTMTRKGYALTQRWAASLRLAGFGGIRYEARHATGAADRSFALFGAAGDPGWPDDPNPLPGREAATRAGVRVSPPPRSISRGSLRRPPRSLS